MNLPVKQKQKLTKARWLICIDFFSSTGSTNEGVLKQYYYDAVGRIRTFSDCLLLISPLLYQQSPSSSDWSRFMSPPNFHGIRHEWHRYQIWGYEVRIRDRE